MGNLLLISLIHSSQTNCQFLGKFFNGGVHVDRGGLVSVITENTMKLTQFWTTTICSGVVGFGLQGPHQDFPSLFHSLIPFTMFWSLICDISGQIRGNYYFRYPFLLTIFILMEDE